MKYLTISLKLMSFFYAAKGSMHHVAVAMVIFPHVLKRTWLLFSQEDMMFSCESSPGISLLFTINCLMWRFKPLRRYFSNHGNNIITTLFQYLHFLKLISIGIMESKKENVESYSKLNCKTDNICLENVHSLQRTVKPCTVNSVTTLNNSAPIVKKTINETSESLLFNYYYYYHHYF